MRPTDDSGPASSPATGGNDSEFRLLDLGDGRQLARYGELVVDRPFPAATGPILDSRIWAAADLRYERGVDAWTAAGDLPDHWTMRHDDLLFELRPTPAGQVGFFAEQIEPWRWLRATIRASVRPINLLNVFAYTGGSTLAAAAEGATVTHLDAARSPVAWARRNAELSGLGTAPVRWIVDDAQAFVERELRRGRRYDAIVLDPPSYGHGPQGERWTLADRLPELLDGCLALADGRPELVLLTAHTEGLEPETLADALRSAFIRAGVPVSSVGSSRIDAEPLILRAESGASAPAGVQVRWRG
ncbi:MAG TPA: class I SAM-dependent methyltransferase [Candidatus Saccharimonadales bacterium]|nr:class I SAM-dependent methyltransferase [Candidatus Saccharimonadales bacterium]